MPEIKKKHMILQKDIIEEGKYHIPADSVSHDDRTQVINHYDTFGIFDRWGDIHPHGKNAQGIFHQGTRYINLLELRLNRTKPLLLSSSIKQENEVLSVDITNADLNECNIRENTIHIAREQFIRNGIYYEEINLSNYSAVACDFDLSISFGADFKDIFEIRGMHRDALTQKPELLPFDNKIVFRYKGLDGIGRETEIIFKDKNTFSIRGNTVWFHLKLAHQQKYKIEYAVYCKSEEHTINLQSDHNLPYFGDIKESIRLDLQKTRALFATLTTSNENFNNWLTRSRADLQSLLAETVYGKYPYAGVPWYNTAFGRDGIITAMEVLWIAPEIARDVLVFLAGMQSHEMDASNDAEPGKIIHEIRSGEMANTGEVPFKKYYGTIDATPLFLMLAGMYYEQTADMDTIKRIWPEIKEAIAWIDKYGDIDGDGFVEYEIKSEKGLTNQGWKDSHDSIMYANGELCKAPIALCEVQAYVYGAKKYMALVARELGETQFAEKLKAAAASLKKSFNEKFWDEDLNSYVLALDGDKKPCRVLASNAGHCLFAGIADPEKAKKLAGQLTGSRMFSGWGVRTLAAGEVRFNPMSYHNGSVWPHDNALIASGLAKYGLLEESMKILQGMFDASMFIDMRRLPELFCGFERRANEGPTAYPVACSPQAWAVGTVFMLLQSCLQMEVNALEKTIVFNKPQLPAYLEKVMIENLRLGEDYLHFELYKHQYDVGFHVIHKPKDWELIIKK